MGRHRCDVYGCTSNDSQVRVHMFPRTIERALMWLQFCKNPRLSEIPLEKLCKRAGICRKHFELSQFKTAEGLKVNLNAKPTLFPALSSSTSEQGLSTAVRVTAEVEDDSQKDLQRNIPTESAESLPEGTQLLNQEITRQSDSRTNLPQTNRPIDVQIGQDEFHIIEETSEIYSLITLPYLELADSNLQRVYRILSGEEVCERIVYQSPDKDDKNGFLLIKDSKWDGTNLDKLHLIAIAYKPGIMSLRDLGVEHLYLLQNIYSSGMAVIMEKYGVLNTRLCIFIKYAPDFYHLHVHFTAVNDVSGPHFVAAHPLHSVIQNIQVFPKYYQAATLGLRFKESDKLFQEFEARGLVERIRPSN